MTEQKSSTLHEQPIESSEHDHLNFTAYVDQLMEFIEKHETPLTIGIYGEWGSGKTSLMRLLKKRLEESRERYCTVWFTAWRYGGESTTLRRTFLLSVLSTLAKDCDEINHETGEEPFWRRWWRFLQKDWWHGLCCPESPPSSPTHTQKEAEFCKELDELTARLYHALEWEQQSARLPSLSDTFQFLLSLGSAAPRLSPLSTLRDFVQRPLPRRRTRTTKEGKELTEAYSFWKVSIRHRDQIRYLEEFSKKFQDLLKDGKEGSPCRDPQARLVIFIDDLDRCSPEHAIAVLETIKLFLDIKKTIFVIGMDPALVEKGIRHHYHWQEPPPLQAHQYLGKIVHIPYRIPPMRDEHLEEYASDLLEQLPFKEEIPYLQDFHESPMIIGLLKAGVIRNPRHIKQLINLWSLLLAYLKDHPYQETQGAELFTLLMAKQQWPSFFQEWKKNPRLIFEGEEGLQGKKIDQEHSDLLRQLLRYIEVEKEENPAFKAKFNLDDKDDPQRIYTTMLQEILPCVPLLHLQRDNPPDYQDEEGDHQPAS